MAASLQIKDVSKSFPTVSGRVDTLHSVNLDIAEGEFLCLVGPSGCGKTTLLNLIAGLERIDSGDILLDGESIGGPDPERMMVFQEGGLFPWLTVSQNVEFGLKDRLAPKRRREKAAEFLKLVHLEKFSEAYMHELSVGMRQRVAIARALVLEPRILLMDEPFAALDTQTRSLLGSELRGIHNKLHSTILFVTHHVREAAELGDRIAMMTFRPGSIKRIFTIDSHRPRIPDDPRERTLIREIDEALRAEVEKGLAQELAS